MGQGIIRKKFRECHGLYSCEKKYRLLGAFLASRRSDELMRRDKDLSVHAAKSECQHAAKDVVGGRMEKFGTKWHMAV